MQDSVISTLDLVEAVVNLFNFTVSFLSKSMPFLAISNQLVSTGFTSLDFKDPFKSSLVFWVLVAICVVFLIIPTRYLFFVGGLVRKTL